MLKVIIQPCHGIFEPTKEFDRLIKSKGYKGLWSIEARTDKDLIEYIEKNISEEHRVLQGKDYWTYVCVVEVDTSKPWCIEDYDGSEYIKYIRYEVLNKELNYVRMTE